MMQPYLRDMRAVDIVKLTKVILPKFVGWVVMLGEEEIGSTCVIIAPDGRAFVNFDITDKLRKFPVFMHRNAKAIVEASVKRGDLYAIEDQNEPRACAWLEKLRFKDTGEVLFSGERVFKWQH